VVTGDGSISPIPTPGTTPGTGTTPVPTQPTTGTAPADGTVRLPQATSPTGGAAGSSSSGDSGYIDIPISVYEAILTGGQPQEGTVQQGSEPGTTIYAPEDDPNTVAIEGPVYTVPDQPGAGGGGSAGGDSGSSGSISATSATGGGGGTPQDPIRIPTLIPTDDPIATGTSEGEVIEVGGQPPEAKEETTRQRADRIQRETRAKLEAARKAREEANAAERAAADAEKAAADAENAAERQASDEAIAAQRAEGDRQMSPPPEPQVDPVTGEPVPAHDEPGGLGQMQGPPPTDGTAGQTTPTTDTAPTVEPGQARPVQNQDGSYNAPNNEAEYSVYIDAYYDWFTKYQDELAKQSAEGDPSAGPSLDLNLTKEQLDEMIAQQGEYDHSKSPEGQAGIPYTYTELIQRMGLPRTEEYRNMSKEEIHKEFERRRLEGYYAEDGGFRLSNYAPDIIQAVVRYASGGTSG
jgi:hypothetical protein